MQTPGHILCFGEILLRLSTPGGGALFQLSPLDANFGSAKANVAIGLSRLGVPSAMVSTCRPMQSATFRTALSRPATT